MELPKDTFGASQGDLLMTKQVLEESMLPQEEEEKQADPDISAQLL